MCRNARYPYDIPTDVPWDVTGDDNDVAEAAKNTAMEAAKKGVATATAQDETGIAASSKDASEIQATDSKVNGPKVAGSDQEDDRASSPGWQTQKRKRGRPRKVQPTTARLSPPMATPPRSGVRPGLRSSRNVAAQ